MATELTDVADSGQPNRTEVTRLLHEWRSGDGDALDRLVPVVYGELRAIARRHLGREQAGHTLDTGALVHEAYISLLDQSAVDWQDRAHFFAIASRTMRRVLVWHARRRNAVKRSGRPIPLDEAVAVAADGASTDPASIVALDEALERLERVDPRLCRVVECRHFGGLTVQETAVALGVSDATVKRDWRAALAWLRLALDETPA